jgi:hypothetical protein
VREDYSADGTAWEYFSHDAARSKAYRWGGIAGISDDRRQLCFALALWNAVDPILKERMFGLTGNEGNHGRWRKTGAADVARPDSLFTNIFTAAPAWASGPAIRPVGLAWSQNSSGSTANTSCSRPLAARNGTVCLGVGQIIPQERQTSLDAGLSGLASGP